MKKKSIYRILITIIALTLWLYPQVPRYHTFIDEETVLAGNEYYWQEIVSKLESPISVQISSKEEELFDAYILDEEQMHVLQDWMKSDEVDEPELTFFASWEGVNVVDAKGINMPEGVYFLVLDNTSLGESFGEASVQLRYTVAEKY